MKPSLTRKEEAGPSRDLISPGCSGPFTIHTGFRISRYRLEKSTLWLYLKISSNDLFHSSLSIISQKNQCSFLKKRKITITKITKYIFLSKKDSSMIVLMLTNTMISFLSVFPLHLTLVKSLSRREKGKNSIKIGRDWNNKYSVVDFSGSFLLALVT